MLTQPRQQAIPSLMRVVGEGKRDDCSTRRGNFTKMIDVSLSLFFVGTVSPFPPPFPLTIKTLPDDGLKNFNVEKSFMQTTLKDRLPLHTFFKIDLF